MQKFIDIGSNVRFFNTVVYVDKVSRKSESQTESETGTEEEPEPAPTLAELESDLDEHENIDEPDANESFDLESDSEVQLNVVSNSQQLASNSVERAKGKCPFYLKGRRPKNGNYPIPSEATDSRQFSFQNK